MNPQAEPSSLPIEAISVADGTERTGHARWVRLCHWVVALGFLVLVITGGAMLMTHPRLYWGEVGNDLTPALIELPISRNHRHGGFTPANPITNDPDGPVSASRTYPILNLNSWGRSAHFLAAWFVVFAGSAYLAAGLMGGHLRRDLLPERSELRRDRLESDLRRHARLDIRGDVGGPPYGILQKLSYAGVVLVLVPVAVLTGLTMSPTVTAALPILLDLFGGFQSARTIHFFVFLALLLFFVVHVLMVLGSGFGPQIRAMTLGRKS